MNRTPTGREAVMKAACELLDPVLRRSASGGRPVVLMVCGCAGSGKSTLANAVVGMFPTFRRISFDGILAARHGLYGIDYPESDHGKISDGADIEFFETAKQMLSKGKDDIVLDRAFYAKEDRDSYKQLIDSNGARWVLVFLKAPKEVLWQRIQDRREAGVNADCALEISKELLDMFFNGFEVPVGEGEIVVDTHG